MKGRSGRRTRAGLLFAPVREVRWDERGWDGIIQDRIGWASFLTGVTVGASAKRAVVTSRSRLALSMRSAKAKELELEQEPASARTNKGPDRHWTDDTGRRRR
jgi:hypothetical protein